MGNIVGKQFGVVASLDLATAIAESVKEDNQAKFYLAQRNTGKALDNVTKTTDDDRNTLVVNGNLIQGISHNDFAKLNAITDVTKIFKYKGSVQDKDALFAKEHEPSTKKGDVWNVEQECTIDGVSYPAHTNFVYIDTTNNPEFNWDSLGGTMQIGTYARRIKENDSSVSWRTTNRVPVAEFALEVDGARGLYISEDAKIGLRLGTAETSFFISSDAASNKTYTLNLFRDDSPIGDISIALKNGLKITEDKSISLSLATTNQYNTSDTEGAGISGLDIQGGGLYVVLSSSAYVNKKFLVNKGDGISLDYIELVNSLMTDFSLKIYISSLIKDALKAQ